MTLFSSVSSVPSTYLDGDDEIDADDWFLTDTVLSAELERVEEKNTLKVLQKATAKELPPVQQTVREESTQMHASEHASDVFALKLTGLICGLKMHPIATRQFVALEVANW